MVPANHASVSLSRSTHPWRASLEFLATTSYLDSSRAITPSEVDAKPYFFCMITSWYGSGKTLPIVLNRIHFKNKIFKKKWDVVHTLAS